MNFTKILAPFLIIFLYIPIIELFISPLNCEGYNIGTNEVQCWKSGHLLLVLFSLIGIILYLVTIFLLTYFYFYPFVTQKNIKMNSSVDIILLLI